MYDYYLSYRMITYFKYVLQIILKNTVFLYFLYDYGTLIIFKPIGNEKIVFNIRVVQLTIERNYNDLSNTTNKFVFV